jgi:hypothetical protein
MQVNRLTAGNFEDSRHYLCMEKESKKVNKIQESAVTKGEKLKREELLH